VTLIARVAPESFPESNHPLRTLSGSLGSPLSGARCVYRKIEIGGKLKMKKWMVVFFAVLSLALAIPAGLWAQAGATGAITGTVLDPKGGIIVGATIVVTNVATGQKERQVISSGAGTFNIPSLHHR
jgi:hypothetical protein